MIAAISFTSESGDHYLSLIEHYTNHELDQKLVAEYGDELPHLYINCVACLGEKCWSDNEKFIRSEVQKLIELHQRMSECGI